MRRVSLVLVALALVQCGKPRSSKPEGVVFDPSIESTNKVFKVSAQWLSPPAAQKNISVRLTVTAVGIEASSIESVTFDPQMPSHGHGTFVDDQVVTIESPQKVKVDGVYFIMGGPWVIHFTAAVNGKTDTALIPVDVP